ncbi:GIY-YIG nuclease family protein [Brucella anthropi]|uniref:GIY-YIG nuclease family protein n=1 Tax=Brucella anthropi TaxID=529 RepID=UPI00320A72D5
MNHKTYVYFIKPFGMDGPIKIGVSEYPQKRIETLAVWSPFQLEIIAEAPGSLADEQFIHSCFADVHSHKEWFNASPLLLKTIEKVKQTNSIDWVRRELKPIGPIRNTGKGSRVCPEYRKGLRSYSSRIRHAENRLREAGWKAGFPSEAAEIMNKWYGNSYRRIDGVRPSADEFAKLDQYLATLHDQLVSLSGREVPKAA